MTGKHSLLKEQHRFLDTVFGTIWQGIIPYSLEQHRCLDNVFRIIYDRESLPNLGTTHVSGSCIWDYMTGNHSQLWEQHKCLNNVFRKIWQGNTPYSWEQHRCLNNLFGTIRQGITTYSWEQHRCLDNVFGIISQGITPYTTNTTGFWIQYLGLQNMELFLTLGTTQVSG